MLDLLKSVIRTREIEFLCHPEDEGVIPVPYPARKLMPEWFKNLPQKVQKQDKMENSTIKRCAPFLDAMTVGWIIPLAADVEFTTNEDGTGVSYKWSFYRPMVENHTAEQVAGHPELPKPPMKFLNYWLIKVPPGTSLLFTPPLNRADPRFECISGLVDVDNYFEFINFPFFFRKSGFTGIVKQGTPLVQVIPLHRPTLLNRSNTRVITPDDQARLEKTRRQRAAHESLYRDHRWVRK